MITAYKYDAVVWENVPPTILESKNAFRYKSYYPDYGIDCVSLDFNQAYQCKYYGENSYINFRDVSTFLSYSNF